MPDPSLSLKAMGASAVVSAVIVLALVSPRRSASPSWLNLACVLGIGLGLAFGYGVLGFQWTWPPVKGLDRFLMIVVPTLIGIELIAGFLSVPNWFAWFLRMTLAATTPRILLHDSVYLSGSGDNWIQWNAGIVLASCGGMLAGTWGLLSWLAHRSAGVSVPLVLGMTIQCAGLTVMMAGYLKGGIAAFPWVATVVATAVASKLFAKRIGVSAHFVSSTIIGIGMVGLFSLLFIGHFFGRLSASIALVLLWTPLLCFITELPLLRRWKPWHLVSLRFVLVAIPLLLVLAVAKHDFDQKMAPLLKQVRSSPRHDFSSAGNTRRESGDNGTDDQSQCRLWI